MGLFQRLGVLAFHVQQRFSLLCAAVHPGDITTSDDKEVDLLPTRWQCFLILLFLIDSISLNVSNIHSVPTNKSL